MSILVKTCPGCEVETNNQHLNECIYKVCKNCGEIWPCANAFTVRGYRPMKWNGNEFFPLSAIMREMHENSLLLRQQLSERIDALYDIQYMKKEIEYFHNALQNIMIGMERINAHLNLTEREINDSHQ